MSDRGKQLHAVADAQITDLIGLLATMDEATLSRPCPGRNKLGDGTVAACALHTATNYERIASFVQTSDRMSSAHGTPQHEHEYTAREVDLQAIVGQLSASRETLGRVAQLTDSQLDAIPPKDSFRFCDGQRTVEQVLASLLKHQRHQVDALTSAIA